MPHIITLITLLLCILVTARAVFFRKKSAQYYKELKEKQSLLEIANQRIHNLEEIEKRFSSFKNDLNTAELTTNMQKSRLHTHLNSENLDIPERYRYVQGLSEKGVCPQDIASILSISNHEAKQLVALANLSEK